MLTRRAKSALPEARLVIELGRFLVGEAGVYVCKVIDRKISRGQVFLVTDGGLHHHLAASGNFGQVIRKNYPVVIGNKITGATNVGGFVLWGIQGTSAQPLTQSLIEKLMISTCSSAPITQNPMLCAVAWVSSYLFSRDLTIRLFCQCLIDEVALSVS